jgi:lipocalin
MFLKPKKVVRYLQEIYEKVLANIFFAMITTVIMSQTVSFVNVAQYTGKWYEIAAIPQWFQKGCNCTTAKYTVTNKGYMMVENRYNKKAITQN